MKALTLVIAVVILAVLVLRARGRGRLRMPEATGATIVVPASGPLPEARRRWLAARVAVANAVVWAAAGAVLVFGLLVAAAEGSELRQAVWFARVYLVTEIIVVLCCLLVAQAGRRPLALALGFMAPVALLLGYGVYAGGWPWPV